MKKINELSIADLKAAHEFVKASLEKNDEDKTEESDEKVKASEEMCRLENYLYHELLNRVLSLEP